MTDAEKKDLSEKLLVKFLVKTSAVFIGTTLAILVSASILRPKCPCPMRKMPPGIERPVPPMGPQAYKGDFKPQHNMKFKGHGDFRKHPDFNNPPKHPPFEKAPQRPNPNK